MLISHDTLTHRYMYRHLLTLTFLIALCNSFFINAQPSVEETFSPLPYKVRINIDKNDIISQSDVRLWLDSSSLKLINWKAFGQADELSSSTEQESSQATFDNPFTLMLELLPLAISDVPSSLHVSYISPSHGGVVAEVVSLPSTRKLIERLTSSSLIIESDPIEAESTTAPITKKLSWSQYLSGLMQHTHSSTMRLILALLLGLLLSLTPCIYPMIPITIGILQAQASRSVGRNFLLSLSYTLGIATTFACLGLMAAFTGQMFGQLLTKPAFILSIVVILTYLAGSMFGWYEVSLPRWISKRLPSTPAARGGSFISAFIFGAASGTITSPCLSPGLLLLLSIVSTLGSKVMGFLLLFTFGMGLGIPLLIIGTFSGSMQLFPKAGMWMLEIKKVFGFILIAMNFYFLSNIVSFHITLWMTSLLLLTVGAYYLTSIQEHEPRTSRHLKKAFGIALLATSVLVGTRAYEATYEHKNSCYLNLWELDYESARAKAQSTRKKLFIDVSAPFCSICKAIEREILDQPEALCILNRFVCVKLTADMDNEAYTVLHNQFKILGVPTLLVVDPATQHVAQRWGSEVYDMNRQEFLETLERQT